MSNSKTGKSGIQLHMKICKLEGFGYKSLTKLLKEPDFYLWVCFVYFLDSSQTFIFRTWTQFWLCLLLYFFYGSKLGVCLSDVND